MIVYSRKPNLARSYRGLGNNNGKSYGSENKTARPAANLGEKDDSFILQMALPGYTKKDIIIDIDHDVLQISSALEGSSDHLTKMEFSVIPFNRKFQLPESADTDNIAASFKNGVLNINIPKKEYAKAKPPREIAIA